MDDPLFIDDLHFGVPSPGFVWQLATAAFYSRRRRCRGGSVSAWYFLKLMGLRLLAMPGPQSETIVRRPMVWPSFAAVLTAVGVIVLPIPILSQAEPQIADDS